MTNTTYKPGEHIYRWWDSGSGGATMQPLTVVRVNRLTYTVRTDQGTTFRLPLHEAAGLYTVREAWEA